MVCLVSARIADIVGGDWQASSGGLNISSGGLGSTSEDHEAKYTQEIIEISSIIADKKKAPKSEVEAAILALCRIQGMRLEELGKLLDRSPEVFLSEVQL